MQTTFRQGRLLVIKITPARGYPHVGKFQYVVELVKETFILKVTQYTSDMKRVTEKFPLTPSQSHYFTDMLKDLHVPVVTAYEDICDGQHIALTIGNENPQASFAYWTVAPKGWEGLSQLVEWIEDIAWSKVKPLDS